jgi:hypothetical protein
MRVSDRSERRHHIDRLKNKRKTYWGYPRKYHQRPDELPHAPLEMSAKQLGRVVQYPKDCSCAGCGNIRRWPWMNEGERSLDERRGFAKYAEQLEEV